MGSCSRSEPHNLECFTVRKLMLETNMPSLFKHKSVQKTRVKRWSKSTLQEEEKRSTTYFVSANLATELRHELFNLLHSDDRTLSTTGHL